MLPAADEALATLERARVFANLDARSGFWQVPVHKDYVVEHIHHTRGATKTSRGWLWVSHQHLNIS